MCQSLSLLEKIAVLNVGYALIYFCGRHKIFCYNFAAPERRETKNLSLINAWTVSIAYEILR